MVTGGVGRFLNQVISELNMLGSRQYFSSLSKLFFNDSLNSNCCERSTLRLKAVIYDALES